MAQDAAKVHPLIRYGRDASLTTCEWTRQSQLGFGLKPSSGTLEMAVGVLFPAFAGALAKPPIRARVSCVSLFLSGSLFIQYYSFSLHTVSIHTIPTPSRKMSPRGRISPSFVLTELPCWEVVIPLRPSFRLTTYQPPPGKVSPLLVLAGLSC